MGARFKSVGEGGGKREKKKREKTNEQKAKTASKHRRRAGKTAVLPEKVCFFNAACFSL